MRKFKSYKNWINEKFQEDDDPIESIGIGMMHEIDKWIKEITAASYSRPTDNYGKLIFCIRANKVEFAKYLLPIVVQNIKIGEYPYKSVNDILISAVLYRLPDIVKILIEDYGADIHYYYDRPIYYSLAYANRFEIFKYFVEDLGLDIMDQNGRWFLHVCAQKDNVKKVQYFVDHGADVNMQNDQPLFLAAVRGRTRAMRILLKNGAKINETLLVRLKYWKLSGRRKLVTNMLEKMGYKF